MYFKRGTRNYFIPTFMYLYTKYSKPMDANAGKIRTGLSQCV